MIRLGQPIQAVKPLSGTGKNTKKNMSVVTACPPPPPFFYLYFVLSLTSPECMYVNSALRHKRHERISSSTGSPEVGKRGGCGK